MRKMSSLLLVAATTFGMGFRVTLGYADTDIGYRTVAEALASLMQMKGVSFSSVRGWTIVTDEVHFTVWSFAPKTDPSYPAVVKRTVISTGSGSKVTTSFLCEADRASCDNLKREFSSGAGPKDK
jgi:hypothetical protein